MVTKEDITTQKLDHTAIFMTWRDFFFFFNIFYNYPTIFPTKPDGRMDGWTTCLRELVSIF